MTAAIDQFNPSERTVFVYSIGHQSVRGYISIVPQSTFNIRCQLSAWMNFDVLATNHSPATLSFYAPILSFGSWATVSERIAMRYLEKSIGCEHRPDLNRLK